MRSPLLWCVGAVAAIAICNLLLYTYTLSRISSEEANSGSGAFSSADIRTIPHAVPSAAPNHTIPSAATDRAVPLSVPSAGKLASPNITTQTTDDVIAANRTRRPDDRPHLVLHIGPIKTGSSTIQCSMPRYQTTLENDNYYYLGKVYPLYCDEYDYAYDDYLNMKPIVMFLKRQHAVDKNLTKYEPWRNFTERLQHHRAKRHNVVISDENMFMLRTQPPFITPFLDALRPWNVKIVIVYRRYYEWMLSAYNQYHKLRCFSPDNCAWRNMPTTLPTFDEFWKRRRTSPYYQDPVGFLGRGYRSVFEDVEVVNLHTMEDDLLTVFLCEMLPGAKDTCEARRGEGWNAATVENPSVPLHFDMLTHAAVVKRLVDKHANSKQIRDAAAEYAREQKLLSVSDFLHKCPPSTSEERLLNRSLTIEKKLFPEWFASPEGETKHRAGFADALEKKKFCSVYADKVLKEEKWQAFFKSYRSESGT